MISKEEMIKVIYEKIADKTLSFGCKMVEWWTTYIFLYKKSMDSSNKEYNIYLNPITKLEYQKSFIDKIIWHPIMIGDVLDYIDKYYKTHLWWDVNVNWEVITRNWNYLRKTIEEQSDDCITYVYNLIK